jgi:hypothetical protein
LNSVLCRQRRIEHDALGADQSFAVTAGGRPTRGRLIVPKIEFPVTSVSDIELVEPRGHLVVNVAADAEREA